MPPPSKTLSTLPLPTSCPQRPAKITANDAHAGGHMRDGATAAGGRFLTVRPSEMEMVSTRSCVSDIGPAVAERVIGDQTRGREERAQVARCLQRRFWIAPHIVEASLDFYFWRLVFATPQPPPSQQLPAPSPPQQKTQNSILSPSVERLPSSPHQWNACSRAATAALTRSACEARHTTSLSASETQSSCVRTCASSTP